MTIEHSTHGRLMASEAAESTAVFFSAARQKVSPNVLGSPKALYTIARGSSDAAANVLSYEFMRRLRVPVTSLPPSVFSLGTGVELEGTAALVVSQSGASEDLVLSAKGASAAGANVVGITNKPGSAVEAIAGLTLPIGAGPEFAVPATKSVIGSIAAGMALPGAFDPEYRKKAHMAAGHVDGLVTQHPSAADIQAAFLRSRYVYVIGRDTGYGAAHEVALKLKECCALLPKPIQVPKFCMARCNWRRTR